MPTLTGKTQSSTVRTILFASLPLDLLLINSHFIAPDSWISGLIILLLITTILYSRELLGELTLGFYRLQAETVRSPKLFWGMVVILIGGLVFEIISKSSRSNLISILLAILFIFPAVKALIKNAVSARDKLEVDLQNDLIWIVKFINLQNTAEILSLFLARLISLLSAAIFLTKQQYFFYLCTLAFTVVVLLVESGRKTVWACPRCKNNNLIPGAKKPYCPLCKRGDLKALMRSTEVAKNALTNMAKQQKIAYNKLSPVIKRLESIISEKKPYGGGSKDASAKRHDGRRQDPKLEEKSRRQGNAGRYPSRGRDRKSQS